MVNKKSKKFFDKSNSISFKLVPRSQNDPLFVDETAPQYVLVEKKSKQVISLDGKDALQCDDDSKPSSSCRKEEQIKYGIYFDDDYDYLQHLCQVEEKSQSEFSVEILPQKPLIEEQSTNKIMLPSSLFESRVAEKEDLSVKAALPVGPQLDWDPDIVEALDEDFDFDDPNNQLDDDFVSQAMKTDGESPSKNPQLNLYENDNDNLSVCGFDGSDEDDDEYETCDKFDTKMLHSEPFRRFFQLPKDREEEDCASTVRTCASTHFTEYSISSSVLPRNEKLKTLDEKFEQMFIQEYGDNLDDNERICGPTDPNNSTLLLTLADEYQNHKNRHGVLYKPNDESIDFIRKFMNKDLKQQYCHSSSSSEEQEEIQVIDTGRKGNQERLDCESVLSLCSNSMYHPTMLTDTDRYGNQLINRRKPIKIDAKTGIPYSYQKDVDGEKANQQSVKSSMSRLTELSTRIKNQTSDERRKRKQELKEFRHQRRLEKKTNRLAFLNEKLRMQKSEHNKAMQSKLAVL